MSTDKVFRWILFITAAAIVFTVAAVISRPDTADSSVESRLGSFLNLPESCVTFRGNSFARSTHF